MEEKRRAKSFPKRHVDDDDMSWPTPDTTVGIKSITDTTITVTGYGVVFGGVDLEGDTFERDTDYMLDLVPHKPECRHLELRMGQIKCT